MGYGARFSARHERGVPVPAEEGLINQDQDTPREWRAKTPAQGPAFRRLGRAAIVVAALLLVGLTWLGARDAIWEHRSEARARVRAELLGNAVTFEEQLRRELLSIDQTLRILEYEWQRDASHFDLAARAAQVVVVNDVALQLFIADDHGIVRLSTRPTIIGTDVTQRDYFRYEAALPTDDGKMFVGELTQGQVTRLWQINLVRRLDDPTGHFSGVIAASYDTNAFARLGHDVGLGRDVELGTNGIIGVVSERDGEAWTMPTRPHPERCRYQQHAAVRSDARGGRGQLAGPIGARRCRAGCMLSRRSPTEA